MSNLQIRDLPLLKDLTPEQLKELFGAGRIRPTIEALEQRIAQAGDIDLHGNGVLEIRGEQYEDWARVDFRQIGGVNKVVVDLFSARSDGGLINAWQTENVESHSDPAARLAELEETNQYDSLFDDQHETFNLSEIRAIFFNGREGNDYLLVTNQLDEQALTTQLTGAVVDDSQLLYESLNWQEYSDWDVFAPVSFSGGAGDDYLVSISPLDSLALGHSGYDVLYGGSGQDAIIGGDQDDHLSGGLGEDVLVGGEGNDCLFGDQFVTFTEFRPPIHPPSNGVSDAAWADRSMREMPQGDNTASSDFLVGYDAEHGGDDDQLYGGNGTDVIWGHGGGDTMDGGAGSDWMFGGAGDDDIWGDTPGGLTGNDILYGGSGYDEIYGEGGSDRIYGGADRDQLHGGSGVDYLYGEGDADQLWGDAQGDYLYGGASIDVLWGGSGNDSLYGGDDTDYLHGGLGDDWLYGNAGNDYLYGDDGLDRLFGQAGADYLDGGKDVYADYLFGGDARNSTDGERDTFVFYARWYNFATGTWVDVQEQIFGDYLDRLLWK